MNNLQDRNEYTVESTVNEHPVLNILSNFIVTLVKSFFQGKDNSVTITHTKDQTTVQFSSLTRDSY